MIADNFYKLKIFLVQGYKIIKNEFIVFENPVMEPWYKSIIV